MSKSATLLPAGTAALCLVFSVAACSGGASRIGGSPLLLPLATRNAEPTVASAARYKVLYAFKGGADGAAPWAGVTGYNGLLYGTTNSGGTGGVGGTIFSLTTAGKERVLHYFGNGTDYGDGKGPQAGLVPYNGTLYGTTAYGGLHLGGTAFATSLSGKERFLHSFYNSGGSTSDGAFPQAGMVLAGAMLYGTTSTGGVSDGGTVYSISSSGKERVLYGFNGVANGREPWGDLVFDKGVFYGTTYGGGTHGAGTVFSVGTSGAEHVLYNFGGGTDGFGPQSALIDYNGVLYGTTSQGGTHQLGTVFAVTPAGKERVIHSFGSGADGSTPLFAGVVARNGALYGTTDLGGAYGAGTIFAVTLAGKETVLHSFGLSGDGAYPHAGLSLYKGALYGTTAGGGAGSSGTVYVISP